MFLRETYIMGGGALKHYRSRFFVCSAMFVLWASAALANSAAFIDLTLNNGIAALPFGDGTVRLQAVQMPEDDQFPHVIVVEIDDFDPHTVNIDAGPWVNYGQWAGAMPLLDSDGDPSLLFEIYSGGAHCCSLLWVITPVEGELRSISFGPAEGELRAELPSDIDGDGIVDLVREGEHTCLGETCVTRNAIYNIVDGNRYDVTSDPRFQPYLADLSSAQDR